MTTELAANSKKTPKPKRRGPGGWDSSKVVLVGQVFEGSAGATGPMALILGWA